MVGSTQPDAAAQRLLPGERTWRPMDEWSTNRFIPKSIKFNHFSLRFNKHQRFKSFYF